MTEPTVQVPVSLIERAQRLVVEAHKWGEVARGNGVGGVGNLDSILADIDALLSQPTPSAPVTLDQRAVEAFGPEVLERTGPPRIEDMAPGTRAAIERADLVLGGFVQHNWASSTSVHEWYLGELRKLRDAIDPSTIRDVTPPREDS